MQKFGLIGQTLGHSFSRSFFTEKFERENISAIYSNYELASIDEFPSLLSTQSDLKGLNVTIPYKSAIIPFLDELDEVASAVGAVNTIVFESGKLKGYNTDVYGFQQSIKPFLRNIHERALILGTGGASKAVELVLSNLGISVSYLSRNPKGERQYEYGDANELMMNAFKLIVNTTPLGTFPNVNEMPSIPVQFLGKDHLVIDLIYNPSTTKLLQLSAENGADTLNGLSMLQHQALKAWEIWNA